MQKIVGKVAFTPKGEHNINVAYEKLDTVTSNNTMFIALKNVPAGTAISNAEYWQRTIDGMGGGSGIIVDDAMSDTSTNPVQNKVIKSYVDNAAGGKVDKVTGKTLTSNDFTDALKNKLDGIEDGATANAGTITGVTMNGESKGTSGVVDLGTVITSHQDISGKVDKEEGKGLSTNDFTTELKTNYDNVVGAFEGKKIRKERVTGTTDPAGVLVVPSNIVAASEYLLFVSPIGMQNQVEFYRYSAGWALRTMTVYQSGSNYLMRTVPNVSVDVYIFVLEA